MAPLVKQSGRYYLQFYDAHRSPKRKKLALKTSRKRPAKRKQRELEDAYTGGSFDPWRDDPFSYDQPEIERVSIQEALNRFLKLKCQEGRAKSTLRTSPLKEVSKPRTPSKLPKSITEAELAQVCQALKEDKARAILDDVEEGALADYVFRSPGFEGTERKARCFRERASKAFRKARKKAGLKRKLSFHSLRHGFCTRSHPEAGVFWRLYVWGTHFSEITSINTTLCTRITGTLQKLSVAKLRSFC